MKKYIIIILLSCCALCTRNYKSDNCFYNYSVSVGNNISIDKSEAETAISSVLKQSKSSPCTIEIIIYSNSSGKEIYSYSDYTQKEIIMKTQSGGIEALVKIRLDNHLQDVIFLKASGSNKKDNLQKLALKVREVLCD